MQIGLPNILSCPYCKGKKAVTSLVSGNTIGATVWSDTRRYYPMLPEVSPIQQCPHCHKYFFIEQAKSEQGDESDLSSDLGKLDYFRLKEAREQMGNLTLTKMQRWILNHQLFMAYNDEFHRFPFSDIPSEEDKSLFDTILLEMLDGIDRSEDYRLFHAELLRESGRFDEAASILEKHTNLDDRWIVDAMERHIRSKDKKPFLLIEAGERV